MKMKQATDFAFLVMLLCDIGMASAVTHVAVIKGERLTLKCEKKPGSMDWKNSNNVLLFFNNIKAYQEPRYSIHSFSDSDYTLMVSPVTFKDEGMYTCYHYSPHGPETSIRRFNVTVLGPPKITTTEHGDRTLVKCSAKGYTRPKISWEIGKSVDFEARPQYSQKDKTGKWITEDTISVKILKRKETIKCVLHHPSLPDSRGVRFVTLENKNFKPSTTQASSTTTVSTQQSTSPTFHSTDSPHVSTGESDYTETTTTEASQNTDKNINTTSTPEDTSSVLVNTSSTLDKSTSVTKNGTSDLTGEMDEKAPPERRQGGGSSSLFICAVTALIICLLIVVTFLVVKLRRAHKKWKLEKEESDQSVESGKSKSSGEERKPKVSLGFLKSNFRKYKGEGALGKQTSASTSSTSTSVSTSASKPVSAAAAHTVEVTVENHTNNGVHHSHNHRTAASPVKETEL